MSPQPLDTHTHTRCFGYSGEQVQLTSLRRSITITHRSRIQTTTTATVSLCLHCFHSFCGKWIFYLSFLACVNGNVGNVLCYSKTWENRKSHLKKEMHTKFDCTCLITNRNIAHWWIESVISRKLFIKISLDFDKCIWMCVDVLRPMLQWYHGIVYFCTHSSHWHSMG